MEETLGNRLGTIVQFDLDKGIPGEIVGNLADGSMLGKSASTQVWLDTTIREWVEAYGTPGCAYQFVTQEGESHAYYCETQGVAKLFVRSG